MNRKINGYIAAAKSLYAEIKQLYSTGNYFGNIPTFAVAYGSECSDEKGILLKSGTIPVAVSFMTIAHRYATVGF
jgi:hypothetical protein